MSKYRLISPPAQYKYVRGDEGRTSRLDPCHACDECDAHGGLMACAKAISEYCSSHNDEYPPAGFCYMSDGWVNRLHKEHLCVFCFEELRPARRARAS